MRWRIRTLLFPGVAAAVLSAATVLRADILNFDIPDPVIVSDSGTPQVELDALVPAMASLDSITVSMSHEWVGDLTVKLIAPNGSEFILFAQPGLSEADPLGSSAVLGNFIPNADPDDPSFTLVPMPYRFAPSGDDFEAETLAAVISEVLSVVPSDRTYAGKKWASGPFPAGAWQMIVLDGADFSGGRITAVQTSYTPFTGAATLSWNPPSEIAYGTALSAAQLNASVTANGAAVPGTFTYTPPAGTVLAAGTGQTLSVSFVPQDPVTFPSLNTSVTINVRKAPLLISADNKAMSYGGVVPELTATYSGFVNGDTAASLTQPIVLTTGAASGSPNGTYAINISGGASPNYTITLQNGTLTIGQAVLTMTAANQTRAYGTANPPLIVTYSGFINGDSAVSLGLAAVAQTTATASSPPGTYPITVTSGPVANYSVSINPGTLTITKAPLTVAPQNTTKTYGAALPSLTAAYSGFVNGDTVASLDEPVTLSTAAAATSPPGTYPIIPSGGLSQKYDFVMSNGTLTVVKAPLYVTPENATKTYGAPLPSFSATYSGFINSDTVSSLSEPVRFVTSVTALTPVGTYPLTLAGGASANYSLIFNSGTLTVSKAVLTATADNKTKAYGAPLPSLTATYAGFVNGDTEAVLSAPVSLSSPADATSAVGTYPITVSGGSSLNYDIVQANGTLTVSKAPLVVTADDKSKAYGAALPGFTASYSGFVNGDTAASFTQPPSVGTSASAASPVGQYPITASGGSHPNYELTFKSGTLTITKAPLTISADNKTKVYGAPLPELTATYTGFVNGDSVVSLTQPVSLQTLAEAGSPAGTYPITIAGGASPNYALELRSGTLTIGKVPLVITANDAIKAYGAPIPPLTVTISGLLNGDSESAVAASVQVVTTASESSPAGAYQITASSGVMPNYSVTMKPGTLTVTPAPLSITAEDKLQVYGATRPEFSAVYDGLVNGDTPASLASELSFTTTATAKSGVGKYPITVTGGASPNYTIHYRPGTLTIAKARLTVAADAKSAVYGSALPAFTASYNGFVNGDAQSNLQEPVVLATTAKVGSPVGTYPITVSGGASTNYTLVMKNGTLTVTKAPLTIKAEDKTKPSGAPLPVFTVTYSGWVNGDGPAALTQAPNILTSANQNSAEGRYPIIATGAEAANYVITFLNGTLTVTSEMQPPQFDTQAVRLAPDGGVTVAVNAPPGTRVRLERSDDLKTWVLLGTQTAGGAMLQFSCGNVDETKLRFFRVVLE